MPAKSSSGACKRDDRSEGYLLNEGRLRGVMTGGAAADNQHPPVPGKEDCLRRLRRIEGQARGLQRMVADERFCLDILTQVSAMTKALQSVALGLLGEHLSHGVVKAAAAGGDEARAKLGEVLEAVVRLVRP